MKKKSSNPVKKADLSIQRRVQELKPKKHFNLDTSLKWMPLAALFALDAFSDDPKEKLEKHIIEVAAAELLLNLTIEPLKRLFMRQRPDGKPESFPSSHTATSFLGSEMLRQELKDEHPVAGYAGYMISTSSAVLRLYHNKHWFSDVLAGAVLGVLAVKLSPVLMDKIIYGTNIQPAV